MLGIYTNETEAKINGFQINLDEVFKNFEFANKAILERNGYSYIDEVQSEYMKEFYRYKNETDNDRYYLDKCDMYNDIIRDTNTDNFEAMLKVAKENVVKLSDENKVAFIYILTQDLEDSLRRRYRKQREEIKEFEEFVNGGKK